MSVRAKFVVTKVTQFEMGGREITLSARYDSSIPEDQRFAEATPSGELVMHVNNPAAYEQLAAGKVFYLDFTEAPEGTSPMHV